MSGHKRTTVSLNEVDLSRLEGIEEKLKLVENDFGSVQKKIKEDQKKEMEAGINWLRTRQENFLENYLDNTSIAQENMLEEIRNSEILTGLAIENKVIDLQNQLLNNNNEVWDQSLNIIRNYQMVIDEEIVQNKYEINNFIQNKLLENEGKIQIAIQTLESAQALNSFLSTDEVFDKYFPKLAENMIYRVNQGWENIQVGMIESGFMISQDIINELQDKRNQAYLLEMKRKYLLSLVRSKAKEIVDKGEYHTRVRAIGLEGDELDYEIDVSYWSKNQYLSMMKKAKGILHQINRFGEKLSFEELEGILSTQLIEIDNELSNAIYWARRNVLASQIRFNIANCVVKALLEQGFKIVVGNYTGRDQRGSYQALLRHIDGSEVVIQVSELDGEIGQNQIDIETQNAYLYSEHELRQRAKEMATSLSNYGLQVGKVPIPNLQSNYPNGSEATKVNSPHLIKEKDYQYGRN